MDITIRAGGQGCKVSALIRRDGSGHISFESTSGYGFPSFGLAELEALIMKLKTMAAGDK